MSTDLLNPVEEPPEQSSSEQESAPAEGGLRALFSLIRAKPLKSSLIAAGALLAIVVTALGMWMAGSEKPPTRQELSLQMALNTLDRGDYETAKKIVTKMQDYDLLLYKELGGASYVMGAATFHQARLHWSEKQKQQLHLVAARYLEEARDYGFPADRQEEGLYMLARSLHENGRYAASLPILQDALKSGKRNQTQLYRLLATAYLRDANPQFDRALQYNRLYLSATGLTPSQRDAAVLQQARILQGQGDLAASRQTLANIPSDSQFRAEAILQIGRLLLEEADALLGDSKNADDPSVRQRAEQKYREAVKQFRLAQANDSSRNQATKRAKLLMGVCYYRLEDYRAAETQLQQIRTPQFDVNESVAADLHLAEVLREIGKHDGAVAAFRRAIVAAGEPDAYSNTWISLDEFRQRIQTAYAEFLAGQQFQHAIALSESLYPMMSRERSMILRAEAHRAWAMQLAKEAEDLPFVQRTPMQLKSRAQYRKAGKAYSTLAKMRIARREYPDDLWKSAENYSQGRDYQHTVRLLREYLKNNARNRTPRALVAMGQAQLALDEPESALKPLLECVERYPKHPDTYQARLTASQVYMELAFLEETPEGKDQQVQRAKQILVDNLHNEALTPASLEWRDSLFALGVINHRQGAILEAESRRKGIDHPDSQLSKRGMPDLEKSYAAHQEAIKKLDEAVSRYPTAPQALEAMFMLAESHRQSAKWQRKKLAGVTIETTRLAITRQVQQELQTALNNFESLQKKLNEEQDRRDLTDLEKQILRNCYFNRADILFDLEDYQAAITAYSSATNRFHGKPESLEAFVQIARCYRELNQPAKARGTLEQAKVILKRIPQDANFTETTRYSREEWSDLLQWLSSL